MKSSPKTSLGMRSNIFVVSLVVSIGLVGALISPGIGSLSSHPYLPTTSQFQVPTGLVVVLPLYSWSGGGNYLDQLQPENSHDETQNQPEIIDQAKITADITWETQSQFTVSNAANTYDGLENLSSNTSWSSSQKTSEIFQGVTNSPKPEPWRQDLNSDIMMPKKRMTYALSSPVLPVAQVPNPARVRNHSNKRVTYTLQHQNTPTSSSTTIENFDLKDQDENFFFVTKEPTPTNSFRQSDQNLPLSTNNYLEKLSARQEPNAVPFIHLNKQAPQSYLDQLAIISMEVSKQEQLEQIARTKEDEDRYLRMVSTETNVKKLNGENPYAITEVPLNVVFGKVLDSLEDAAIEFWSHPLPFSDLFSKKKKDNRPTVVVLGTGWASHSFIQQVNARAVKVIVVSPVNHFVFTPMLASAAVGTVEYRSMTEAIRVTNPYIENYIDGQAIGIDVKHKYVTVQLNAANRKNPFEPVVSEGEESIFDLYYDYLVCAVGTKVRSSFVPGAAEYCYNLKTTQDSKRLRFAIGEALEYASRPDVQGDDPVSTAERQRRVRFVIIGGGATGVELAAELNDFLAEACRSRKGAYHRLANDVSVVLVHGGSDLLPQFDPALRLRALRALEQRGVEVKLNTYTTEVGTNFVTLKDKETGQEETIPAGITAWGAGNEPVPFIKELLNQLPPKAQAPGGRIQVDGFLRCPTPSEGTFGSIFILGDTSYIYDDARYPGGALPQTAQVAGQQGTFLARMMNRGYVLDEATPRLSDAADFWSTLDPLRSWLAIRNLSTSPEFKFLNLGLLAYVGGGEALTQVQLGDVPLLNLAGKRAFILWRSVYLAKQAGSRNQAQLVFDWMKSRVFGRDITRL